MSGLQNDSAGLADGRPKVYESIVDGISKLGLDMKSVTLISDKETLISRWKNDKVCEWRTDEWLEVSIKSLPYFESLDNTLDTGGLSIKEVADMILS